MTNYVLRLNSGEELIAELKKFFLKKHLKGAWFWGLGSADEIEIAFYDLKKRKYVSRRFRERLEILNITGNISRKGAEPIVHAHGTFGRPNYSVIGGHILSCRVSATLELYIAKTGSLKRRRDPQTGLNLLT